VKKNNQTEKAYKSFLIYISLSISLIIFIIFSFLFYRDYKLVNQQELDRARTNFNSIVLTRRWNANHGGVYVEKKEGVKSNPYLINPDIYTTDGKTYTKKNPALMTKEISEIAEKTGFYKFHITSLNPLNPKNIPDKFERKALENFVQNREVKEEFFKITTKNGNMLYRYMAPLVTEESCLTCHEHQGYEVGDIRGGISVLFNIDEIEDIYKENTMWLAISLVIIISLMVSLIYFLSTRLFNKLRVYEKQLLELEKTNTIYAMSVTANHEINQPLTVLSGYLEIIKMAGTENLNNKQIKSLNNMRKSIVIIANILQKYKNSNKVALGQYAKGISMVKFDESNIDE